MTNDKIQDLTLCDNFLFASVMSDAESCRGTLEIILGVPIAKVQVDTDYRIETKLGMGSELYEISGITE